MIRLKTGGVCIMKKLLCLCLCAGFVFGAGGCGNAAEPAEQTAQQTQEETAETSEQTKEKGMQDNQSKAVNADDFFEAMNTCLEVSEVPTLDEWEREDEEDGTIKYKYILDGEFVDVSCSTDGTVCVSYWGDQYSDFTQIWATSMLQAIKYFEGDDIQSVVDQLQLLSITAGEKVGFGKNGNTYIFSVDSVSSVSDRNNVSCILMIK